MRRLSHFKLDDYSKTEALVETLVEKEEEGGVLEQGMGAGGMTVPTSELGQLSQGHPQDAE